MNYRGGVMEIQSNKDAENVNVGIGRRRNTLNQRWEITYANKLVIDIAYKKGELNKEFGLYVERQFSVISRMAAGRYLDIVGNKLVIKRRNGFNSQKWFFDQKSKTIKSVQFRNLSWNIMSAGKGRDLEVYRTTGEWFQSFKYTGQNFVNTRSLVVTVQGNKDVEGQPVVVWNRSNGSNQRFMIVYSDKETTITTKGRDSYFGLHVGRPFYIHSHGFKGKVVEVVGGRNLALRTFIRNK